MKKAHIFCTKIWFYLCEIPPIILLIVTILHNNSSDGLLKLYPLIVFSLACIVFIFIYFFRMINITFEEIKMIGLFSSKESTAISKDKTLVLSLYKRNRMVVRLRGNIGSPSFNWAKPNDYASQEIDLFREKAVGNLRTVKKILTYFKIPPKDINDFLDKEEYKREYEDYIVSKTKDDDAITVSIKFLKTI